jgi:multiple sugar transport system substrate-binding protein
MAMRERTFRIAVRKFEPFEISLAWQWNIFEQRHRTSLQLEAVPLDLHPLHESLFAKSGLQLGEWDAAMISTDWLSEAAESSALTDLTPYLKQAPPEDYPQGWSDSLLRLQRFEDLVLGLPYHDGPECLIYRKDLFENSENCERYAQQYGEPLNVPRTWEQFHRLARFFNRPQEHLFGTVIAAYPDGHNTVYDFCLQLWTRGGELFDDSGAMRIETSEARDALDFYRTLLQDTSAVHPESRNLDSVKSGLAFAAGEVAMMVNWFGFASMSETTPQSKVRGCVGVAPLPSGAGRRASLNAYWVMGLPVGSRHPEITWHFLRHCASPEMDKLLTLEGGIGCRKSTWSDAEVNVRIPFYHCLEELHEEARELPRRSNWSQLAAVIDGMLLEAINTAIPTVDILRRAQRLADKLSPGMAHGGPR